MAEKRGDYGVAVDWYRRSLAVWDELGDRARMAQALSRIGAGLTEIGGSADAVPYNLRALSLGLEMQMPEAFVDVFWLCRQRTMLGEQRFLELVPGHLDADRTADLLRLLSQASVELVEHPR